MKTIEAPTREELIRRASDLIPLLQKNALSGEENRRLPQETVEALAEAGIFKMRVPHRFGGYESDMRTVVDTLAEIARGDGSAAWVASVYAISAWMVGLFPDEVQDEIFSTPDVRISGILSPTAMAHPVPGGVVVNGKWSFNSGVQDSHWNTNAAILIGEDGQPQPVMLAIPVSELTIVDDWHTAGLRGSGSVTTLAENVFVPEQRVLPMVPVLMGQHRSVLNAGSPLYSAPFMPTACATISAPALGMAKAARDAFFDRLPGRKITYTSYENQQEAPLTHLQVAEATVKIDEAEFHAHRAAQMVDAKGAAGEEWTLEERARVRLDLGAVTQRAKEAVDILNTASGGSSVYSEVPIQRIERDVQTLNLHAVLHPNTNLELYGRILCGQEPNTVYL
ncbi:acyl-CoA dehydrogenase family protein [Streptomyces antarcticus]|uniref:acyl-CoA dehydrogenase family protein n=1 Tax=Streptomyces antarcticus TaxID=2996458 RepID=UPI00226FCC77|nr:MULTISPECIES: acyl-CoA dehydrogenase family protein [unclassified Streptomyces]MCY0942940.1 acyl-CoA dehydrogenase family protein [Streptomyces sp. H34-AA3]MCY0953013.1 acyl-CoA dehydrogenase family protein [Streptomyces sp. H27-S2]MCZ4083100.1 acyl-CoA dehydrogenase family protein [Streptomyces sp. H34-S5]